MGRLCTKCGGEFPATLEYFHKHNNTIGLHPHCKGCRKATAALHYQNNRDYVNLRNKVWRDKNPEKVMAQVNAWKAANPDKVKEVEKNWRHRNKAKTRAFAANRRDRQRTGTIRAVDIAAQIQEQDGRCYWCGCELGESFHVDHVIPLAWTGTNTPDNMVVACKSCNLSKSDKIPFVEWWPNLPLKEG